MSYDSINTNGFRLLNLLSFKDFERAVAAQDLPQFIFMSPNMMNDGHNTTLEYAAEWAHRYLKPLLDENSLGDRTLVQLTYDESEDYGRPNRIVSLLLGNAIPDKLKGTSDDTYYSHYSILSTVQNNWELPNLGRYDVGANVFQWVADLGGYTNRKPDNAAMVDNSVSYGGALNNDPAKYAPIPPPNTLLTGAGGKPILDSIKQKWSAQLEEPTPYDGTGGFVDGDRQFPIYSPPMAVSVSPPAQPGI